MKKNKKKLPRFWLGTRMPTSLGYQSNYGIGGYLYTSTPGESVLPEVNTIKSNTIPNTLNKAQTYGSTLASMWLNTATTENAVKQAGTKVGLNAAGKALGVVGAAYGLTDMGFLIANNQDHRTAGDMRNTLTTNTYTTDLGNTYTTHGGVDRAAELDYARKQKLSKNLNFTTTAIGTGATIGSLFSPIGTAIGAGAGALVGLGANLLGFGDTEAETKAAIDRLTDVTSMEDKMSYSLALNKDAQQGFYGRTKSGNLGAKDGKRPIYARNGKGNAMVSHGEVIGNLNEGWAYREPGIPDNNDTLKRHIKADDFVISNKYGLSDYAAATGDYVGALKAQDVLMSDKYMMNGRNTDLLFLAKCGKLPKYSRGTPTYGGLGDYMLTAMPNMAALYSAWDQLQTDKHMPVEAPNRQIDLSGARNALYRMYGDLIDARSYMNAIDLDTSRAIYRALRNPGAGYGGRMVLENAITSNAIAEKARQRYAIDQANLQQRNTVNQALAALDQQQLAWENDNFWKSTSLRQAAQAAKYKALAQDRLNLINPLAAGVKDYLSRKDYRDALGIKERMIKLYENQLTIDKAWMDDWLNKPEEKPSSPNNFSFSGLKLTTPDLMQIYQNMINPRQLTYIPSTNIKYPQSTNFTNIEHPQSTKSTLPLIYIPYYNWFRYHLGMNPNNFDSFVFNSNFR